MGYGFCLDLKPGIQVFQVKWGRDSGLKACTGCGMPKTNIEITRLSENLGRAGWRG